MTYVRRRTCRPPRPRHDVAGPSLNVYLIIAEISSEAGLGGADVAAHCGPMEKEPSWPVAVQLTQTKRVTVTPLE